MAIVSEGYLSRASTLLLCHLMRMAPCVVTPQQLYSVVSGDRWAPAIASAPNCVRVDMVRLRDSLDVLGYRQCVVTVVGHGYRWDGALKEE